MPLLKESDCKTPGQRIAWGRNHANLTMDLYNSRQGDAPLSTDQYIVVRQDALAQAIDEEIERAKAGEVRVVAALKRWFRWAGARQDFLKANYTSERAAGEIAAVQYAARMLREYLQSEGAEKLLKELKDAEADATAAATATAGDPLAAQLIVRPPS